MFAITSWPLQIAFTSHCTAVSGPKCTEDVAPVNILIELHHVVYTHILLGLATCGTELI